MMVGPSSLGIKSMEPSLRKACPWSFLPVSSRYAYAIVHWFSWIEVQRPHTIFEVMGVMAHLPCYPAMQGGLALLMCGPVPTHSKGVLCVFGGERAEAPSTPRTIPGMDFERLLQFSLWYKW
jgi:hypothetical protein